MEGLELGPAPSGPNEYCASQPSPSPSVPCTGLQPPTPKKEEQAGDEASSREPLVERPLNISRATSAYHGAILAPEPSAPSAPEPEDPPPSQEQQPADEAASPGSSSAHPKTSSSPAAAAPSQAGAGSDSDPAAGKQAVAWTSHGEKASEPASKLQPEPTKAKPAGLPRASHAPARQRSPTRRPAKRCGLRAPPSRLLLDLPA